VLYFISLTFLIILALFYTAPAFAACTSPAGVAGTLEWFSGTSEYKICDGTNWDVIELDSVSLGACSPIANREWDATLKAYKICDASGDYKRINCIEDGLVGHWKFNEASGPTAVDSSPSGNDGTYANSPTPTTGQYNNALEFSGELGSDPTHDRVAIGDPADGSLDFGSGSFSYGLWLYATGSAGSYDMPWTKGGGCVGCRGYDMEFGTGSWTTYIGDGDEVNTSLVSASPILNAWTHVMVVVDRPASKHNTYVNGALVTSDNISATFGSVDTTTHANIGAATTGNHPFLGLIDDVRVYNRALTADEVALLYNGGQSCGVSYGACSTAGQKEYDPTDGMLWCDGTDLRAVKAQ
jgi:hypothetical protein